KLEEGLDSKKEVLDHLEPIHILLDDLFPNILTNNEIKAAALPHQNFLFNKTKRFKEILKRAGDDFELKVRNFTTEADYVFGCILILNGYYGYNIDFTRPFYYDIPDENGILRHYRIAANADFVEFEKTDQALDITEEDVDLLLQNTDDIELWKEKFPPLSWVFKGFIITNLTDVTIDDGISDLKTQLLNNNLPKENKLSGITEIFRSIYSSPDLEVGLTLFDKKSSELFRMENKEICSFILDEEVEVDCKQAFCDDTYTTLVGSRQYFSLSNVDAYLKNHPDSLLSKNLKNKGIKSCIFAPIAKGDDLLAILELVSYHKNELNSINAIKLEDIVPYIVTAIERNKTDFENRVKAVIQSECTSIHPSVLWVFEEEARRYIRDLDSDGVSSFRDIAFADVYPLYGQIDIVGSSDERNKAIQADLIKHLKMIAKIIDHAYQEEPLPVYEQVKFRIDEFREDLKENLNASSEQKIINFIHKEIDPLIDHFKTKSDVLSRMIDHYNSCIDEDTGVIYNERKNYDDTVQRINRTLARYIDRKQVEAQQIFPHYFERYKTDGVDHNIYIGESMTKNKEFSRVYLHNIRLWQIQVVCEMENKFYHIQENMPLKLDAASLILVFSSTLSIRYRMDEKKFDVDGTYNARYEIIKKRIDKAYIKNTEERITQKGKIAIIYSQKADEREYLKYIDYLQKKNYLGDEVELLELEDVQGVVGLKALRVEVLYHKDKDSEEKTLTYEDLMEELH
ncbi:GAF domain-containing protein, partial [Mesonia sp.]|uniref:GAF domain-containing protein n=1 Tax=Mesonia sp. TaxID=1960830 RepID=UPI0025BFBDD2